MHSTAHEDIRRLLKQFGLNADETVSAYLIESKPDRPLRLRLVLEDITEYATPPERPLKVEIEGLIGAGNATRKET